jgi:hypothetical protein
MVTESNQSSDWPVFTIRLEAQFGPLQRGNPQLREDVIQPGNERRSASNYNSFTASYQDINQM